MINYVPMRHGCLQPGRKGGAPQRKWQEMSSAQRFFNLSFLSYIGAYVQLQSPPREINSSPAVRYMRVITAFLFFSLVPSLFMELLLSLNGSAKGKGWFLCGECESEQVSIEQTGFICYHLHDCTHSHKM